MTGLAVDARLGPGGRVGVGIEIVVGRELAHMTAVAGGVEGVCGVFPVDRRPRLSPGEMANAARRRVEPLLLLNIEGQREGLQTSLLLRRQEVVHVLPTQDVLDLVLLGTVGSPFANVAG